MRARFRIAWQRSILIALLCLLTRVAGDDEAKGTFAAAAMAAEVEACSAPEQGNHLSLLQLGGMLKPKVARDGPARRGFANSPSHSTALERRRTGKEYIFLAHHKTGTSLAYKISSEMADVLGMVAGSTKWIDVKVDTWWLDIVGCRPDMVNVYEDMRVDTLDKILHQCPDMRAVHLIRDLPETLVSNYVYTLNLQPGEERDADMQRSAAYRRLSLEDGMELECTVSRDLYFPQLVETHQFIQKLGLPNIMTVRYENWMDNFHNVTRAMFEHFIGKDHPLLDEIVRRADEHDISQWSEEQINETNHISDLAEKAQAADYLLEMYKQGNACAHRIADLNAALGYYDWPPS